ncbi:NUDIX hydrolase [Streptomyces griseoluteus]|uniref:NUDIX hydrolase n=1 Tax=Streptomyces griseoluteus TaxID=29306 RepID=UPI0036C543B3
MVFDRYRQCWELPGGRIEQDESPRQAAGRELWEESGQEPDAPSRLVGYARFVLAPDRRAEHLAVFAGHCSEVRDFRPMRRPRPSPGGTFSTFYPDVFSLWMSVLPRLRDRAVS